MSLQHSSALVMLVNGPAHSAAADRASKFLRHSKVAGADSTTVYRIGNKLVATFRFLQKLLSYRPELVYVMDMAFSGVIAGSVYRAMNPRACLIIDTGDAIYELAKKTNDRSRIGLALTAMIEWIGQRMADRLVVRGSEHPAFLAQHSSKAVVIQDGVCVADYAKVPPIGIRESFDDCNPLVIGVLGSLHWNARLSWCYGAELVEVLNRLKNLPVQGVIIGSGSGLPHLKKRASEYQLGDKLRFIDAVPPEKIPGLLATIDIALSTQTNDTVGRVRTTGKLPLYLAAGRYVLASDVGEARRVLPDAMLVDYHGAFDPTYPARLTESIKRLVEQPSSLGLAHSGPPLAQQFDYSRLAERLDHLLLPFLTKNESRSRQPTPVVYLALGIHQRGGMERAAYEVITRIRRERSVAVIARESECVGVPHDRVWAPRRPAMLEVAIYKWRARRQAKKYRNAITTGIGASGGPVDVVIAQYCQEAYRQRIGAIRGRGFLRTWWQKRTMAHFCAEERAVYQSSRLRRVIAVSRGVGKELIDYYGVNPALIRYVPNGVDLSVFMPASESEKQSLRRDLGLPSDAFLACFVGGDWRRKGLKAAIESLAQLPDVHLIVVGAGDCNEFSQYASAAGVLARVHFIGKKPNPQDYMRASDVYVFPSSYEAFSLSCIEAAACGLPLIVTRINGTEELVEHGENGFFVFQDAESISDALMKLQSDPALRQRMAATAAQIAQRYSWDTVASGHQKVYGELDDEPVESIAS